MRQFTSIFSSVVPCPSVLSFSISSALSQSTLLATPLLPHPFMNFRGAQSAPAQATQNAATAAGFKTRGGFRFHPHSEREIHNHQHHHNAQLGAGGGGGGGGELSGGTGEEGASNSGWNHEHEQQQQGTPRGEREQRWRESRAGRDDGNKEGEEAQSSGAGGAMRSQGGGGGGGDGGRGRGGWRGGWRAGWRGEGRLTDRGRGRRGDWTHQHTNDDWIRRAESGEFRRDGRVPRPRHIFDQYRHWCCAETELPASQENFVLVSYNILADKNAAEHYNELYHHIPWWLMNWDRRKRKLVEELGRWAPDIMCLQEVDKYEDLQEEFQRRGYCGAYKGRTGGARDGCAIFWKTTRFQLLEEKSIQFNELGLRDNVAQLCVFQSIVEAQTDLTSATQLTTARNERGPGGLVVVGNIHVLFNPKRGDIKLGQVRVLLESAHALSKQWGGAPVTIAGDFNSTPMSDLYKFLATSELDISGLNRAAVSGQVMALEGVPMAWVSPVEQDTSTDSAGAVSPNNFVKRWYWTPEELMAATGTLDCATLRHNLNLRSAYSQIKGEIGCRDPKGEPLVTTFHRKFMGTVDYIWHTEGIDTVKVLDTLPVNVLQLSQGLPSKKWGSDHLALACELAFSQF